MGRRRAADAYPETVPAGAPGEAHTYVRRTDCFALRGAAPAKAVTPLFELDGGRVAVYRGAPPETAGAEWAPVYSLGEAGAPAVPTGLLFVRLEEGLRLEEHAEAFREAGFEIERILSYAPQAGWVRPRRGGVPAALNSVASLTRIRGVARVEPQMLQPAARR
jgi:hypothetical protein